MMHLGPNGLALLKHFEQCRLTAYRDSGGVWTIGWGHTGPEVREGLIWTQAQADEQFERDTQGAVLAVIKGLDIALGQNAFDALVCFAFNVGTGAEHPEPSGWLGSTLRKLVNARYTGAASAEFLRWDHVKGIEVAGLKARRLAEKTLFLTPDGQPVVFPAT